MTTREEAKNHGLMDCQSRNKLMSINELINTTTTFWRAFQNLPEVDWYLFPQWSFAQRNHMVKCTTKQSESMNSCSGISITFSTNTFKINWDIRSPSYVFSNLITHATSSYMPCHHLCHAITEFTLPSCPLLLLFHHWTYPATISTGYSFVIWILLTSMTTIYSTILSNIV